MAEKKIQARIRQKVDTKANWDKATNFVPLKGEYIYYSDLHKVKVGDGVTKVGSLPFLADSDTHSITGMYVGATNAKTNAATTNGNTYLKLYDDSTKRAEFKIVGSGATKVSSDANGNITISSTDTNTDTNTSHNHNVGIGLAGSGSAGTSGGTYTYKAKLRSETALTVDSAAATTSGRAYPVAVDKSGYLSLNVPLAGFEDILKGIKGRTQVEWNALNAGEYGSNSTYNGATLPPVILENNSGFWNSASGKPLDISFHFAKKERITTLQVKCPPYSGANPTMTVYYAQKGDTGLTLYKEIATISTADRKAYEFNEEGISADYWVVRFTSSNWIDLRLCSPSGLFTTGLYTEECHQQIMDRFNGYQPVGNYALKNEVIAKSLTSTKGDMIYASAANTPARLGIGSNGQFLSIANGIPKWVNNPNTDTHFTTGIYVGKANEKSNSATTNGNTYLKLFDNDTKRSQHLIHGTGLTTVASDASGTITINSTLPTNLVTTTQLVNKLDKNNASGTGSFTWTNTEKGKPLDIKFVATTDQSGVDVMGFNATDTLATLTGSAYMGNTKFTLQSGYSDGDGPSIVIDNNGYKTTITANGINPGDNGNIQWPTSGGRFVTSGDFANENATDLSANQGKIPKLEYPGTIPLKFIKPMVSMYASENDLPGAVHFSPYYVPDALYVTTDTNSIYRYNQDTESYVKLGPDTSKFLDKGTSSTVVNQVVYNPVEMKKALTVPSVQGTKYTDNSGNQQPLFTLGGTASGSGNSSQASSSLTLYRNRAGSWDSATISFAPVDGLKIGNYAVGVQDWNRIPTSYILTNGDGVTKDYNGGVKLKSSGGAASDDFVFESTNNGKLHSKMSVGPNGLVRGGWCIDDSKIITEATIRSVVDAISTESILSICI